LITPCPLTPTLFPYTTLFRSLRRDSYEYNRLRYAPASGTRSTLRSPAVAITYRSFWLRSLSPRISGVTDRSCAECPGRRLGDLRSEEHTSELQSRFDLVCRLL